MSRPPSLRLLAVITAAFLSVSVYGDNHKPSPNYIKQLILVHGKLVEELAGSAPIIDYLASQKECKTTLAEIFEKDTRWLASKTLQTEITGNTVAIQFSKLIANPTFSIAELILTDGLGATVAAYPAPSDFWQGDETKFSEPVKRNDLFISDIQWDESTEVYSFFVAKPIFVEEELYGVLIAGVDVTLDYILRMPFEELVKLQVKPTHHIH